MINLNQCDSCIPPKSVFAAELAVPRGVPLAPRMPPEVEAIRVRFTFSNASPSDRFFAVALLLGALRPFDSMTSTCASASASFEL